MRVRADATASGWRERREFGDERARLREQFLRAVAAHPGLDEGEMRGIRLDVADGNLMRAPRALETMAVDFFGSRPALGRAQHDHRPARPRRDPRASCLGLQFANLAYAVLERRGHLPMHRSRVGTFNEIRRPAEAYEQRFEFFGRNARQNRRVRDFVAVEMENRQDGAVVDRIEELI